MSLNRVRAQDELVSDPLGPDTSLGEVAYRELVAGQSVRIDILAAVLSVSQLQLLAGLSRDSLRTAGLGQLDGSPQQRAGSTILAGTSQQRAQPMAEPGLQHRHPTLRCQIDRLMEQARHRLGVAFELFERSPAPGGDDPGEAAWQT